VETVVVVLTAVDTTKHLATPHTKGRLSRRLFLCFFFWGWMDDGRRTYKNLQVSKAVSSM
jgi:hypothetical protein